jgi:hypothetical protein
MSPLVIVVHAAAVVLAVAGATKLVDPGPVTRSLGAAGLPAASWVGRLLGAGEVGVGAWVLVFGGAPAAAALATWYAAFTVYLVTNRLRGLAVPCGCIVGADRPAGAAHLVVDVVAVAAATWAIARPVGDVSEWLDDGAGGIVALAAVALVAATVVVLVLPGRIGPRRAPH